MPRSSTRPDLTGRIARGWSAADVDPSELVDDAWIAANTKPGRAPSTVRHLASRTLQAVRTIGVDPLDGQDPATAPGLLPRLPRPIRRSLIQRGGLTRDQMRRIAVRTGYPYVEAWSTRTVGLMRGVWGALIHHTGTAWSAPGDYPTLRVVRDGRSDLQNSLCAFGLGRAGTAYLISEKLSWHGGPGNINGCTDANGFLAGIEAESDGVNWTPEQRDAYPRLVASILIEIGQTDPRPNYGDKYTTRHATYALPSGRKTDASGLDMDLFWRQVYGYLANSASIHKDYGKTPVPAPAPAPAPAPVAPARPPRPAWSLPAGHFIGPVTGPATCHSGDPRYDSPTTRALIRAVQQWLIFLGFVPGVARGSWATSRWADSVWGPESGAAMVRWHNARYSGQPQPSQCWADDYRRLIA